MLAAARSDIMHHLNMLAWTALSLFFFKAIASTVVDFSSQTWTLENQHRSISVPGQVPSYVHLDLLAAGTIDDP